MPDPIRRVFVAGSRGQLGHDLLALLPDSFDVRGLDLPELDITSTDSIRSALDPFMPDAIVNAAAFTNVDACETEHEAARAANVDGPRHLAEYARAHDVRLVHVSTDYVFDGRRPLPQPYVETDATDPITAYGRTKLAGERAILEITPHAVIARTAWLYGAHGRNFLKTMLRLAVANPERALRVVNDQHGCPTWSRRLAEQILALLSEGGGGVYHVVGEGACTWFDLARTFLEAMGVEHVIEPCTTADYPTPAQRPRNSILANAHLNADGLCRMKAWEDDLVEFVNRYREPLLAEARTPRP